MRLTIYKNLVELVHCDKKKEEREEKELSYLKPFFKLDEQDLAKAENNILGLLSYNCTIIDNYGKKYTLKLNARNEEDLEKHIASQGFYLLEAKKERSIRRYYIFNAEEQLKERLRTLKRERDKYPYLPSGTLSSSKKSIEITPEEEQQKQASLKATAIAWRKVQEVRLRRVATSIMAVTKQSKPLEFYLLAEAADGVNPDVVNAATDGEKVYVTRGMMRFIRDDDELAIILGHEMAHAYLGHLSTGIGTTVGAVLVGIAFGPEAGAIFYGLAKIFSMRFSIDKEREADLYGQTWAHWARYNAEAGIKVWERFAIEIPESLESGFLASHPSSAERVLRMEKVAKMLKEGLNPI